MRMLMNNLDDEVAERPQDLVVYGGKSGAHRAARKSLSLTAPSLVNRGVASH